MISERYSFIMADYRLLALDKDYEARKSLSPCLREYQISYEDNTVVWELWRVVLIMHCPHPYSYYTFIM